MAQVLGPENALGDPSKHNRTNYRENVFVLTGCFPSKNASGLFTLLFLQMLVMPKGEVARRDHLCFTTAYLLGGLEEVSRGAGGGQTERGLASVSPWSSRQTPALHEWTLCPGP